MADQNDKQGQMLSNSKLETFAKTVLHILEVYEEWNADTIDEIGCLAVHLGLATTNNLGYFETIKEHKDA